MNHRPCKISSTFPELTILQHLKPKCSCKSVRWGHTELLCLYSLSVLKIHLGKSLCRPYEHNIVVVDVQTQTEAQ